MAGRLTGEFVIKAMFKHGIFPELDKAYAFANEIEEINEGDILQGEVNGRAEGMCIGYDKGYAAGKMDSSEYHRGYEKARQDLSAELEDKKDILQDMQHELEDLRAVKARMIKVASIAAETIARENRFTRIKAIKTLREKSGLSLAECKAIMDHVYEII